MRGNKRRKSTEAERTREHELQGLTYGRFEALDGDDGGRKVGRHVGAVVVVGRFLSLGKLRFRPVEWTAGDEEGLRTEKGSAGGVGGLLIASQGSGWLGPADGTGGAGRAAGGRPWRRAPSAGRRGGVADEGAGIGRGLAVGERARCCVASRAGVGGGGGEVSAAPPIWR